MDQAWSGKGPHVKTLKTSKLYTDSINGDDGSSTDQPLLDAFTQDNSALLNGTMGLSGIAGGASPGSATSGAGAGSGTGTSTGSATPANPWNETLQVGTPGHGLCFNNVFDYTWTQALDNCVVAAEKTLSTLFTNTVTVNVSFAVGYSAPTKSAPNVLAAWNSWNPAAETYAWLRGALRSSDTDLPKNDPNPTGAKNSSDWLLPTAYARMMGDSSAIPGNPTAFDGQELYLDDGVGLNGYFKWTNGQDVINALIHELSEGILGRVGSLSTAPGTWSPMDLFRYAAADAKHASPYYDTSNGADGQTTYFSSDGANLSGLSFNNQLNSDGTQNNTGDTADWASGQQGVFGNTGVGETFTLNQTELDLIHALGWNYTLPQEVFLPAGGGPTDWQTPTAWVDGFMPITVQDAFIGFQAATATSSSTVTVNSIGTSTPSTLVITGNKHVYGEQWNAAQPEGQILSRERQSRHHRCRRRIRDENRQPICFLRYPVRQCRHAHARHQRRRRWGRRSGSR